MGKLDSTSSLRLDKEHDEPRKSWSGSYIAAGHLRTDTSSDHRAPALFRTVGAKASLLDACFRVLACCAKKKFLNSFTSFSR